MQEERIMAPITTIVHFEVPADNVDRFFAFWQDSVKNKVNKQPGLIDGIFYRGIDADGPFQFINVARWDSAEQLEAGLRATGEELHQEGVEMGKVFQDLGVKVSQNNYVEAVRYITNSDPTQAG
jgi:heme-degrading monooxygenase HmoA